MAIHKMIKYHFVRSVIKNVHTRISQWRGEPIKRSLMRENPSSDILKNRVNIQTLFLNGGGIGIRTLGTREGTTVFKTAPINHSGIPPKCIVWILFILLKRKLNVKHKFVIQQIYQITRIKTK